mgnify:CR=1 FL=1
MSQHNASSSSTALVVAHDLAKTFDVSAPWLNRVVERKPRQFVHAVDGGGGYTYYDDNSGRELSAVLGFTYNFMIPYTAYQSGINMHLEDIVELVVLLPIVDQCGFHPCPVFEFVLW